MSSVQERLRIFKREETYNIVLTFKPKQKKTSSQNHAREIQQDGDGFSQQLYRFHQVILLASEDEDAFTPHCLDCNSPSLNHHNSHLGDRNNQVFLLILLNLRINCHHITVYCSVILLKPDYVASVSKNMFMILSNQKSYFE